MIIGARGEVAAASIVNVAALRGIGIDDHYDDFAFYAAVAFLQVPDRAHAPATTSTSPRTRAHEGVEGLERLHGGPRIRPAPKFGTTLSLSFASEEEG